MKIVLWLAAALLLAGCSGTGAEKHENTESMPKWAAVQSAGPMGYITHVWLLPSGDAYVGTSSAKNDLDTALTTDLWLVKDGSARRIEVDLSQKKDPLLEGVAPLSSKKQDDPYALTPVKEQPDSPPSNGK